ncbi:hypothetical protein EBR56_03630, partial [bacterium]|nr:hypothetical protein [bacterium]
MKIVPGGVASGLAMQIVASGRVSRREGPRDPGEAGFWTGERADRDRRRCGHRRAPLGGQFPGFPRGRFREAKTGGGERIAAARHEPQARHHAELPGDRLHVRSPVGQRPAALFRKRRHEVAPAGLAGERGPELPFERPAAERCIEAPPAHRH